MASLLEHAFINKFIDDIGDAITSVGGDVTDADKPCDYVKIIKDQLVSKGTITGPDIESGDGIVINKSEDKYIISSTAGALTIEELVKPYDTDFQPGIENIPAGTSIQNVFKKLLGEIIPSLPSVIKGDITVSTNEGTDFYSNPAFVNTDLQVKTGLNESEKYLRIFLATRLEPVYVSLKNLIQEYNLTCEVKNGEYINMSSSVQKNNNNITLSLAIDDNLIGKKITENRPKSITLDEIDALFAEEDTN